VLLLPVMRFKLTMFRYANLAKSLPTWQKAFLESAE